MRENLAKGDPVVARMAAQQHGVVSLRQLRAAGIDKSGITRRLEAGRLHRVHRSVYAVGHNSLTHEGRWMAAVLACGGRAVLSHASAGALWNISPRTSPSFVHVTVPGSAGRARRRGITLHRSRTLTPDDITRRHNIPVTTRARTLRDLGFGPEPTRSHLERMFLKLCRKHGIPSPQVNVRVGPYVVDFFWVEAKLVAETDGYRYHSGRAAFDADLARTNDLKRRGCEVLRFSYREVSEQPQAVVDSLNAHFHGHSRTRRPPTSRGRA